MTQPGPAQRPFEFDPAAHHQPIELVAEPDAAADGEAGLGLPPPRRRGWSGRLLGLFTLGEFLSEVGDLEITTGTA